jgi:putative peptidoglycan lipid II flippase
MWYAEHDHMGVSDSAIPSKSRADVKPAYQSASPQFARAAGLIGFATMSSRLLGLVRDQLLAYLFGAGHAMDAFNVAFRIPNLLRDLFAEGAMSAALLPTFTRHLVANGRESAWRLGSLVFNALLLVTGTVTVVGMLFATPLVTLFAGDYAEVPGKLELTVMLTRIMFPFLTLVALAAVCMGMLNSLHRFFVPAISPAMFNVATIVCAIVLVPVMPALGLPPITAIAIGTLAGGLGQVAVQWPLLRREGFRWRAELHLRDEGLRQVLMLMGPGALGLAAVQINILVNTVLATGEGEGAVSWLNYAFRLMYLPIGLFGVSVATAALPLIARHVERKEMEALRSTISGGLRMMLMVNVPATVGLIVLASPIVALIFERGEFTAADTAATAAALAFYAPGLVGYSAVKIAVPSFYALRQSRTPVAVSAMTVGLNVGLNLALVRVMGFRGLALGTAVAALFNAGLLLWLLARRIGGLEGRRVAVASAKILVASIVMGVAAWWVDQVLHAVLPGREIGIQLVRVGGAIGFAMVVLMLAARALRIDEFYGALRAIASRLSRSQGGA